MEGEAGVVAGRLTSKSSNSNGSGLYAVGDGEPLQDLRTVTYHPDHSRGQTRGAKNTETSALRGGNTCE